MEKTSFKHSLFKSVTLHLLPGIMAGICYFMLVPVVKSNGYPSVMALCLAGLLMLIPFQLGVLIYEKKRKGKNSLKDLITYTKPLKIWQYIVLSLLIILLSGLAFAAFGFTSDLMMPLFQWITPGMFLDMGLNGYYEKSKLILTYGFILLIAVIVVPTIEELYFRGYLLPRMPSKLKGWSELTHSGLFALYHTWTPWLFITRTISVLPLIYIVKRKKNVYIGIIAHCLMNSIDFIIGLVFIASL